MAERRTHTTLAHYAARNENLYSLRVNRMTGQRARAREEDEMTQPRSIGQRSDGRVLLSIAVPTTRLTSIPAGSRESGPGT
jgi:hypothetical protein